MLEYKMGQALFDEVVWEADRSGLLSDEHFSVDGTLMEAVASIKSFRRRDEEEPPRPRQPVGGLSWREVAGRPSAVAPVAPLLSLNPGVRATTDALKTSGG